MPDSSLPGWIAFGVIAVLVLVWLTLRSLRQERRDAELLKFVAERGLQLLDDELPYDLPEALTDNILQSARAEQPGDPVLEPDTVPASGAASGPAAVPEALQVRRCLAGFQRGERVVSFDYRGGGGPQRHWTTALAIRQQHPFDAPGLGEGFLQARSDGWLLLWPRDPLSPPLGLEMVGRMWESLGTTTAKEAPRLQRKHRPEGELHIKPKARKKLWKQGR